MLRRLFRSVPVKRRGPKKREPKKRGSKLLRCGAKRPVAAFAGTRVDLLCLIFFDEGRNWASAPHSVGVYSHAALLHKRSTVGAPLAAPSNFRPPSFSLGFRISRIFMQLSHSQARVYAEPLIHDPDPQVSKTATMVINRLNHSTP